MIETIKALSTKRTGPENLGGTWRGMENVVWTSDRPRGTKPHNPPQLTSNDGLSLAENHVSPLDRFYIDPRKRMEAVRHSGDEYEWRNRVFCESNDRIFPGSTKTYLKRETFSPR